MFSNRPARQPLGSLAVLLCMVGVLAGCMDYEVDAEIARDNTISGSFLLAFDKKFIAAAYDSEAIYLADLKRQITEAKKPSDAGLLIPVKPHKGSSSLKVYRTKTELGYRQTFSDVPTSELEREYFRVRHVDKRFIAAINTKFLDGGFFDSVLKGRLQQGIDLSSQNDPGPEDLASQQRMAERFEQLGVDPNNIDRELNLRIRLGFPGQVISSNGSIDERSVSWKLKLQTGRELHVSAWDAPQHRSWLWQIFFGLCAAGGLGVLYQYLHSLLRKRRRRRDLPPEPEHQELGFEGLPTLGGSEPEPGGEGDDRPASERPAKDTIAPN